MYIINACIPHASLTISLNCRREDIWYWQDADDRLRTQNVELQTMRTDVHNVMYDKDAAIEGGYHMVVKEEERKAHARKGERDRA